MSEELKPETEIHVYEGGELVGIYVGEMKRAASWARRANPDAALRTLAERQPVNEPQRLAQVLDDITDQAAESQPVGVFGASYRRDLGAWVLYENEGDRIGQIDGYERKDIVELVLSALRGNSQAAEQRGADRAFEEAARIAESMGEKNWPPATDVCASIAAAIRQRIGGQ